MADPAENKGITEEDLLKSISDLETKTTATTTTTVEDPVVIIDPLKKSAEALAKLTPGTQAALSVSEPLREIVNLLGAHVDASLEAMHKSVSAAAARDLGVVKVLQDLKKSIDANTEAVTKFGEAPLKQKTATGDGKTIEVLNKTAGTDGEQKKLNVDLARREISTGLERLAKSAKDPLEQQRLITATVKWETAHSISPADLAAVKALYQPAA